MSSNIIWTKAPPPGPLTITLPAAQSPSTPIFVTSGTTTYVLGPEQNLLDQIKALEERISHLEARVPHTIPEEPTVQQVRSTAEALKQA